eukprot:358621-Chlamydomonas_euryale.AAC.4
MPLPIRVAAKNVQKGMRNVPHAMPHKSNAALGQLRTDGRSKQGSSHRQAGRTCWGHRPAAHRQAADRVVSPQAAGHILGRAATRSRIQGAWEAKARAGNLEEGS